MVVFFPTDGCRRLLLAGLIRLCTDCVVAPVVLPAAGKAAVAALTAGGMPSSDEPDDVAVIACKKFQHCLSGFTLTPWLCRPCCWLQARLLLLL
jgi:hypothetical protein